MRIDGGVLYTIINEELSKSDISSMINSKIGDKLSSSEFRKKVSEIAADVVNEIFKVLWQRNSFWKSSVSK